MHVEEAMHRQFERFRGHARARPQRREMAGGFGRVVREVPEEIYIAARRQGLAGDPDYWKWLDRRCPEMVVEHGRRVFAGRDAVRGSGGRIRNRFGRVTQRIVYT
jgi:hypothetical protein